MRRNEASVNGSRNSNDSKVAKFLAS